MIAAMAPSPRPRTDAGELALRVLSGLVLATLAIAAALAGGWFLDILLLALALGLVHEWFAMTRAAGRWAGFAAVVAAWLAMVATPGGILLGLYCVVIGAIGTALVALYLRGGEGAGWSAAGTLYAALPMTAILWIVSAEGGGLVVLWLFLVVWACDIGAFAIGSTFGGPKLAPAISPSKTWSGAVGGLAAAMLVGIALAPDLLAESPARGAMTAALVGLAAQAGDLIESRIKRRWGAKDSGRLIPGHGGLMDRLDSLVVAIPAFALVVVAGSFLGAGP